MPEASLPVPPSPATDPGGSPALLGERPEAAPASAAPARADGAALRTGVLALLFLLLALGIYHRQLTAPLSSDARFLAYDNADVVAPEGVLRVWTQDFFAGARSAIPYTSGYYRPVVNALFWLEYRWAGRSDAFYNATEVLLHALNALLVALLVASVARDRRVGALTGVLFVIHPVHAMAATEAAARADVLFASFYLGALLVFDRALERRGAEVPLPLVAGAALLALLSVLSKEMGITVPAALALLVLLRHAQRGDPLARLAWTAPAWAGCALYLVWRFGVLDVGTQSMGYGEAHGAAALVLAQLKTIPIHLSRIALPLWPSYPELNPHLISYVEGSLSDPLTYAALALLLALVVGALLWRTSPTVAFWAALFLIALSPLLRTDSIGGALDTDVVIAQERWIYLPSVAVLALIAQGALQLERRLRGLRVARVHAGFAGLALIALPALAWGASQHAGRHADPFALLKSLYLIPEERLGRMQEANRLMLYANLVAVPMGDLGEAERRVRAAEALVPDSPLVALNVARVLAAGEKWGDVRATLLPWLSPTPAALRAMHRTNFRVLDDLNRVGPEIPLLLARAEAELGDQAAARRLLCEAGRRGADSERLRRWSEEYGALAAAPEDEAANPQGCRPA